VNADRTSKLLAAAIGDRGRVRTIAFREGGREFHARVNEDNLWGAVKDNLVLGEYERSGIALDGLRGVVVDAGAHVGLFSLLAAARADNVVALEPEPGNFGLLSENLARNGASNVEARQCALANVSGAVDFVAGDRTSSGSIVLRAGASHVVEAVTLDAIVEETGPVDLLKLDIEGAEFDVLDGASEQTLRRVAAIAAELHLDGTAARLGPTLGHLRRAGFLVSLRSPPTAYWRESVRAVLRNRGRLQGGLRLRLAVLAAYTLAAVLRPPSRRAGDDELMFLYATRGRPTDSLDSA
jgi:FkbM family methyltransferase